MRSLPISLVLVPMLLSCGGNVSDGGGKLLPQKEQKLESFNFQLSPLNSSVAKTATGTGTFTINGDNADVVIKMNGVAPKIEHYQVIQSGTSCPTAADDTNGDNLIDAKEMTKTSGEILLPLDGDMNSIEGGNTFHPFADEKGRYEYSLSGSVSQIEINQHLPQLLLDGKVLVIYGVSPKTTLPASVEALDGKTAYSSFPVACGVIQRGLPTGTEVPETPSGGTVGESTPPRTNGDTPEETPRGTVRGTSGEHSGRVSRRTTRWSYRRTSRRSSRSSSSSTTTIGGSPTY